MAATSFRFIGSDARDYFRADIGHVEPGDTRDLDEAPDDGQWREVTAARGRKTGDKASGDSPTKPASTSSGKSPGGAAASSGDA